MKINFTKKQYESLLEIVYLGNWIGNATRVSGQYIEEYNEIFQYVFSFAKEFKQENNVEYDTKFEKHFPTKEFEEKQHPIIDEYDDYIFWEELADRLAERDMERSGETFDSHDVYMKRYFQLQTEYEEELAENGVEKLVVREEE